MSKTVPFPDTFEGDYLFLTVYSKINESHMITTIPKIENRQAKAARNSLIVAAFSSVLMVLPFYEGNPLSDLWGISFIALCSLITSLIVALMYNNRSKKMKSLLDQSELLAGWDMNGEMKDIYVAEFRREIYARSKMLLWVISGFFLFFTSLFLFIVKDDWPVFVGIMGSVYLIILAAGLSAPPYYTSRNKNGDGHILIGAKYIYINGYFHNWDFPLSGLRSIQPIDKPFRGIELIYFYTVHRNVQTQEIRIPIPDFIDSEKLIDQIRVENN